MKVANPIGQSPYIQRKIGWAREALTAYPAGDPHDAQTTIVDLIGDLLHVANAEGFDGSAILDSAQNHFSCEGGDGAEPDGIAYDEADRS